MEYLFHSSLQSCFSWLRFADISLWQLWFIETHWFFRFQTLCCRFCELWCARDHCTVAWPSLGKTLAVRLMVSHLTLECFLIERSSCSTQWLKPTSSPLHHQVWQLVWGVCANVLCLVFWNCILAKHLHCGLISPKDIVTENLGICSLANLQT